MNNRLKYAATTVLLIICTAFMMFLPSLYYRSNDMSMQKNAQVNSLDITTKTTFISPKDAVSLYNSQNVIFISLDKEVVTYSEVVELSKNSLTELVNNQPKALYFRFVIDYFVSILERYNDDGDVSVNFEATSVIGEINGTASSVTVVYLTIDNYVDNTSLSVQIDYNSGKIYHINIFGLSKLQDDYNLYYSKLSDKECELADIANGNFDLYTLFADYWSVDIEDVGIISENEDFAIHLVPTVYDAVYGEYNAMTVYENEYPTDEKGEYDGKTDQNY